MTIIDGQLDLLDLLPPVEHFEYVGPSEGFRLDLHPDEYAELEEVWRRSWQGQHKKWRPWRGWKAEYTGVSGGKDNPHVSAVHHADLRDYTLFDGMSWEREQISQTLHRVGGHYYRVWCQGCQWWTDVHHSENDAVRAYLDHCWPGWQDLPVLCGGPRVDRKKYTIPRDYPEEFKVTGAPWLDCRHQAPGLRDHPGDSPFKTTGYSLGIIDPDCPLTTEKQ